jgi:hypothetical protein
VAWRHRVGVLSGYQKGAMMNRKSAIVQIMFVLFVVGLAALDCRSHAELFHRA